MTEPHSLSTVELAKALDFKVLKNVVNEINRRLKVFNNLRKIMKIALPDCNKGLNDDGDTDDIKTIEKNMMAFRDAEKTKKLSKQHVCYKNMLAQIDKYWEKLFADPINVFTPSGILTIQPQRTNNIIERFFRSLKHDWRRKSGTGSLSKKLKVMLAQTPLVKNLANPDYVNIILNGCDTLAERFSTIAPDAVRNVLSENRKAVRKYPKGMRALFKVKNLPKLLSRSSA